MKKKLKFQLPRNRARVTGTIWAVACNPLGYTSLATETGIGDQIWGPGPRSRNFEFLTLRLPPVLWPTFLCTLTESIVAHNAYNARKIHFKTTPKIGGLKNTPHFTHVYYRPKYADKNSFHPESIAFHLTEI